MQLEIYNLIAEENRISVSLEAICDSYSSLLWDIEFYQCGCFEVYIAECIYLSAWQNCGEER